MIIGHFGKTQEELAGYDRSLMAHLALKPGSAFRTCRARGRSKFKAGSSIKMSNIVCHQQPGSTEYGYYVIRYMLDIIPASKIKKSGLAPRMLIRGKRSTRFENYGQLYGQSPLVVLV